MAHATSPMSSVPSQGAAIAMRWINALTLIACAYSVFFAFYRGYEGSWLPINDIMIRPDTVPVFGHRLLFIGIAWLFKLAVPAFNYHQAFFASQIVAVFWTFLAFSLWAREFIPAELLWIGNLLLTAMLVPSLDYYNSYDIAIVGFYAICFRFLLRQQFPALILCYAIGLTNHENLLLIAPIAGILLWRMESKRAAVVIVILQLLIYGAYRIGVMHFLPADHAFDMRLWENLHPFHTYPIVAIIRSSTALLLPILGSIIAFRYSDSILKISAMLLFGELCVVTLLFGQFNEPRQFIAYFAIAAPMILCMLRELARGSSIVPYADHFPLHKMVAK